MTNTGRFRHVGREVSSLLCDGFDGEVGGGHLEWGGFLRAVTVPDDGMRMSTGEPSTPLHAHDPRRVGAYRLLGRLGEGGQGVVFLGEDPRGFRVAVKVLKIDIRYDSKAKARFVREIAAARQVAPFCTARILAFDVEGQLPFVASEFIAGPTLQQRVVTRGPIAGTDLDRLAIGTASAIAAIHGANVVHCDLKPANVILGPDWPRVIDFGVAQAIDGTGTQTIMGSPAYMAPERFHNDGVAPAADIFSWAATIAFAAAGLPPFPGDTPMSIMHRVMDQPPRLSGLSPGLNELLLECLDKDPAARPVATDVLLRLVAKSGLTLEPAARRSIGELTTRVIPKQLRRDVDERLRGRPATPGVRGSVGVQRGGEAAAEPQRVAEVSGGTEPTWKLSAGLGSTRKILSGPGSAREKPPGPAPAPPGVSPAPSSEPDAGPDPDRNTSARPAPDLEAEPEPTRDMRNRPKPTLEMPGPKPTVEMPPGLKSARHLSLGPEPTREMSAKLRRAHALADGESADGSFADAAADPGSADPGSTGSGLGAPGDHRDRASWPQRLRREYNDARGLLIAIVLGLIGAVAGYLISGTVMAAAAIGVSALIGGYTVRLLVAARH